VHYGDGVDLDKRLRFEAGEALVFDVTQPPLNALPTPYEISTILVAPLRVGTDLIGILAFDFGGPPHSFTDEERSLAQAVGQLVALVIDRDRLLRDREEARATALAAQETTRRMHAFLGIASHELRTPVTSIKAGVQLSERALSNLLEMALPVETLHSLQRMQTLLVRADQQANRLHRLIEDVLDVIRTQAGKLSLHAELGDLGLVVGQAVEAQRVAWPGREIALDLPKAPVRLALDADRIEQVVANLLTNALKYSADDQPVAVQVSTTHEMARVAVRDHGPGLSPQMQEHLWELFHQVEGIRQQSGSGVGLGLGLHICRTVIERHGGRVGVDSAVGKGSTFWFELPLRPILSDVPDPGSHA
jgi:signal transduction histidine kinase